MDSTEGVDSGLNNLLTVDDVVLVSDGDTTEGLNFIDNLLRVTEIVNNDLGTKLSKEVRVSSANASTGSSDNDNLVLEGDGGSLGVLATNTNIPDPT